jgi:hypothetical protein
MLFNPARKGGLYGIISSNDKRPAGKSEGTVYLIFYGHMIVFGNPEYPF